MGVVAVFAVLVVVIFFHVLVVEHATLGTNSLAGDLFFIDVEVVAVVVMIVLGRIFAGRSAVTTTAPAATAAATLAARFAVGAYFAFTRFAP